jgi:hypothetical protein
MPPRPLRRWKSFWFGLLIIEFLCWSWHDSTGHRMLLGIRDGSQTLLIERYDGVTRLVPGWPLSHPGVNFSHYLKGGGASDVEQICAERHLRCFQVQDSTILLSFLALWSAYLIWRSWRMHNLTEPNPAA